MSTIYSPNKYEGRISPIRVIVLHTMETDEDGSVAEAVGNYFAKPTTQASAHLGVDTDSTCRYVDDNDTAWAAPGANADGLQLEMAGRAGQTTGQWDDASSQAILTRGAIEVANWCAAYKIPASYLTDAQLADGKTKGITTHVQVSRVFKRSTHWDPGPNFPVNFFLTLVHANLPATPPTPAKPKYPAKPFVAQLTVDGILGVRTIARWQQILHTPVDGVISRPSLLIRAVQKVVGVSVDGILGPVTWKGVQRRLKVTPDGIAGPVTISALQRRLNTGAF